MSKENGGYDPADYQYGSPEQDEWHSYMDGAGTPDYGGRRNEAISGCLRVLAAVLVIGFILYVVAAWFASVGP